MIQVKCIVPEGLIKFILKCTTKLYLNKNDHKLQVKIKSFFLKH